MFCCCEKMFCYPRNTRSVRPKKTFCLHQRIILLPPIISCIVSITYICWVLGSPEELLTLTKTKTPNPTLYKEIFLVWVNEFNNWLNSYQRKVAIQAKNFVHLLAKGCPGSQKYLRCCQELLGTNVGWQGLHLDVRYLGRWGLGWDSTYLWANAVRFALFGWAFWVF